MSAHYPKVSVPNFTERYELDVNIIPANSVCPRGTISLSQTAAALAFQHDMTPDQARKLAMALLDMADQLDPEEVAT
jgi:hypothetical protein